MFCHQETIKTEIEESHIFYSNVYAVFLLYIVARSQTFISIQGKLAQIRVFCDHVLYPINFFIAVIGFRGEVI